MDFNSPSTLIVFILAVVLLDAALMFWLRRKRAPGASHPEGVAFLGQYSPLLTAIKKAAALVSGLFDPGRRAASAATLRQSLGKAVSGARDLAGAAAAFARHRKAWLRGGAFAGAVACGLAAQFQLFYFHNLPGGLIWLIASGLLFLSGCLLSESGKGWICPVQERPREYLVKEKDFRILALLLAFQSIALAVLLYWNRPAEKSHLDIFALWLAGMVFFLLAFWPARTAAAWREALRQNWKRLLPFALIFLLAAGLRFYRLGSIPAIMENDEGTVGVQALRVIDGLRLNMFENYGGYGTLYFFLQALPVGLLGRGMLALRLVTALAGTLTIPLAAWLGWRLFGYRAALAGTLLLAASHLHVHFSRVSPTAGSFDPLFSTALALLLYDALTRRGLHRWAAAGVVMGVGMHFYVGARVMVVIVLVALVGALVFRRDLLRGQAAGPLVMAGGLLVSAGPLLSWASRDPAGFNQRINQVGIFQNGWVNFEMALRGTSLLEILAGQLGNALLIFNYYPADWFYQAAVPAFGLLGGLLLFFGLILAASRLNRLPFLLLSAWFWTTLVTGQVLMLDPPTNAYRTLGLMPAACLLAAAAADLLAEEFGRLWRHQKHRAAAGLLAFLILLEAGWNIKYYFGLWARAGSYGDENTRRASLIGSYLGGFSSQQELIVAESKEFSPKGWQALQYLQGEAAYMIAAAPLAKTVPDLAPSPQAVVIVPAPMQAELERLKARYQAGAVTPHVFEGKLYFWSFVLNGE